MKDKREYVVDPVTLTCMGDNYYLMCCSEKYNDITNYRLNRMKLVRVQISPTFWGWFFQLAGEMQIIEPENLIDTYTALLQDALPSK